MAPKPLKHDEHLSIILTLHDVAWPEHPDLLYVADQGSDLQPLALGVHGVEAAHQVLQEHLECLRETKHRPALTGKQKYDLVEKLDLENR